MKNRFNVLVLFVLLMMLFGVAPASSVRAESLASPLNANGDFFFAKAMGGMSWDQGNDVTVDSNGNVYTTGEFAGTADFDPGTGITNLTSVGERDIFISKLDKSGNFVWAKNMGISSDTGYGIALDAGGNVYTTGYFYGTVDFDPGAGIYNLTSSENGDLFVSKLNSNGNFVWAKNIGGTTSSLIDISNTVVDSSGNVYTTGSFYGTIDFDPGAGIYNLTAEDEAAGALVTEIFVFKLNNNGDFVWARNMGVNTAPGKATDVISESFALMGSVNLPPTNPFPHARGNGIAVDSSGNVYTTGYFNHSVDFDPGVGKFILDTGTTDGNNDDIFISKLNSSGNFVWARSMGGAVYDYGNSIDVDSAGNVYTTGHFFSTVDFDPGVGVFNVTSAGGVEIFISKLNNSGNFVWAMGMGGVSDDYGYRIALDSASNIYTTGYFSGIVDFDPGAGIYNLNSMELGNTFVSKLNSNGNFTWAKGMGGASQGITVDSNGNIYMTGLFSGTTDFDPGAGIANLSSAGEYDIFVFKLEGNVPPTFSDVSYGHPLHDYIEALYDAGFTGGCSTSPLLFCPDQILDRAQSAVFMLRGAKGSGYTPPPAPWNTFLADNWVGFEYAQPWAEGMYQEGLTEGCQTSPLMYCPATQLPRVEASVFGLKMKYGVNYLPPPATGTLFADFPSTDPSYWAIAWAEKAYADGLLPACGIDSVSGKPMFCPSELVNRAWGAYLIVQAKGLPLP